MVERDRAKFAGLIVSLSEVFDSGNEPSKTKMQLYWLALQTYQIEQIQKAVSAIIQTRVFPSLPKPAEIIQEIDGLAEDRATNAWLEAVAAIRRVGSYSSIKFHDPVIGGVIDGMGGWPEFCNTPEKELKWKQKEFVQLYRIIAQRGRFPNYLPGRIEMQNRAGGYEIPTPIEWGNGRKLMEYEARENSDEVPGL